MIIDTRASVNKSVLSVRDAMAHSQISFYLTGSRFFGNAKSHSDWDYFTEDNYSTKEFLESLGFDLQHISRYTNDKTIIDVYHHAGENIHVQFVKDVWVKSFAQEVLTTCILPKGKIHPIHWHIALQAGKAAKP